MIEFAPRFMRDENLAFCLQPRVLAVPGCQRMLGSQLYPAQKRIQVSGTRGGEAKILDSCSSSQIHLWSNTKSGLATPVMMAIERLRRSIAICVFATREESGISRTLKTV